MGKISPFFFLLIFRFRIKTRLSCIKTSCSDFFHRWFSFPKISQDSLGFHEPIKTLGHFRKKKNNATHPYTSRRGCDRSARKFERSSDPGTSCFHRENGATFEMVALIINPIYTPYITWVFIGYIFIYWVYPYDACKIPSLWISSWAVETFHRWLVVDYNKRMKIRDPVFCRDYFISHEIFKISVAHLACFFFLCCFFFATFGKFTKKDHRFPLYKPDLSKQDRWGQRVVNLPDRKCTDFQLWGFEMKIFSSCSSRSVVSLSHREPVTNPVDCRLNKLWEKTFSPAQGLPRFFLKTCFRWSSNQKSHK